MSSSACKRTAAILPIALIALLLMSAFTGCRPPEETEQRLGYVGELCFKDLDCRDGLVCNNSQCEDTGSTDPSACETMCDRLVNDCGRAEENCRSSCDQTIDGWSESAILTFENCVLGMSTPELTCELAREQDAPSFCYAQIPLDEARQSRCDDFINKARDISSPSNEQLTALRQEYYVRARTRPESTWSNSDACVADDLSDDEFIVCLERVFKVTL